LHIIFLGSLVVIEPEEFGLRDFVLVRLITSLRFIVFIFVLNDLQIRLDDIFDMEEMLLRIDQVSLNDRVDQNFVIPVSDVALDDDPEGLGNRHQ
jgi:hypothetical protein